MTYINPDRRPIEEQQANRRRDSLPAEPAEVTVSEEMVERADNARCRHQSPITHLRELCEALGRLRGGGG